MTAAPPSDSNPPKGKLVKLFDSRHPLHFWVGYACSILGLLLPVLPLGFLKTQLSIPLGGILSLLFLGAALAAFIFGAAHVQIFREWKRDSEAVRELKTQLSELQALDAQTLQQRLASLQQKLDAYDSMERAIRGLLRGGGEYSIHELASRHFTIPSRTDELKIQQAMDNLVEAGHAVGCGGISAKYKATSRSQAANS